MLLRREGFVVNHKKVYRLYRDEGLAVRRRKRKKLAGAERVMPSLPQGRNQPTFPISLKRSLGNSSTFFKPLSICETLAVGMAIIAP